MTAGIMDEGIRSPEAAEHLGIRGLDVYMMLFAGEFDGGPGRDGLVYFDEASIERYLERHGPRHQRVSKGPGQRPGPRALFGALLRIRQ